MARSYKPYITGSAEKNDLAVGCKATDSDYVGPVAQITVDGNWLNICTDDYEGNAMLNIEALPLLRRALSKIAKHLKHPAHPPKVNEG